MATILSSSDLTPTEICPDQLKYYCDYLEHVEHVLQG
jgi:hypothetical protein